MYIICVSGCGYVHMGVWVNIGPPVVYAEKCIGRLSTKLQLLSLQLVLCTGMGTIACTPVLLMRSCEIYHPNIAAESPPLL